MVQAQGCYPAAVYDPSLLPQAPAVLSVPAPVSGYIAAIEARDVGRVSMLLGGGRATKEDVIDLSVGVLLRAKVGDTVTAGRELAQIHAATEQAARQAREDLLRCYRFSSQPPQRPPFIRGVVS